MQDYVNPKTSAAGVLTLTGLTIGQQIAYCISALILVVLLAYLLRQFWRRHKVIGDK